MSQSTKLILSTTQMFVGSTCNWVRCMHIMVRSTVGMWRMTLEGRGKVWRRRRESISPIRINICTLTLNYDISNHKIVFLSRLDLINLYTWHKEMSSELLPARGWSVASSPFRPKAETMKVINPPTIMPSFLALAIIFMWVIMNATGYTW